MFIKSSGVIAAAATLAVLAVGGSAAAIHAASSGFATPSAPSAPPVPVGSRATATVPGAGGSGASVSGAGTGATGGGQGTAGQGPGGQPGSGATGTAGGSTAGGAGAGGSGAGSTAGGAGVGGTGSALAVSRAATAALPHSPRLLRELAGPISRGRMGGHATGTSVPGIDVAAFQHPGGASINWAAVAAAGYKFAAVKATEGNYYVNPWAATDLAAAKKAGLYVAPYHFAIPNVSGGAAQAQYAVRYARYAPGAKMMPLMLDIEYDPYVGTDGTNECYGLSRGAMTAWLAAFVQTARSLTGQFPVIYTTADWWDTCTGGSTAFSADPMWVAAYGFTSPPMPAGWRSWTFWQYTSGGTVPGVDSPGSTDLDVFDMSLVGLINPGGQASRAGAKVSLGVAALNTAGRQPLAYTAAGLPPGLAITTVGTITGVVTGAAATYRVTVSARNPAGAAGSVTFSWRVTAPPAPAASLFPSVRPVPLPAARGRGGASRRDPHPGPQVRVRGPVRPRLHDPQAGA
ncbi:MAG TPA: GH25 family lysozyme [Trebonia sp.]|nr:GH25 family lysozyme [Trebonia sp.]